MVFSHVLALLTLALTQISALSIESFEGPSIDRDHRSGKECEASANITCTTLNENNVLVPCKRITHLGSLETCGDVEVNLEFKYCNNNKDGAAIDVATNSEYRINGVKKPLYKVETKMEPGCKIVKTTRIISSCKRKHSISVLFEGDVEDKSSVPSFHCYEYAVIRHEYIKQRSKIVGPTRKSGYEYAVIRHENIKQRSKNVGPTRKSGYEYAGIRHEYIKQRSKIVGRSR